VSNRETLVDRLTGGIGGEVDDPRAAQFVRGLALGALVGAAIAGSTLWQRRRAAAAHTADTGTAKATAPAEPGKPVALEAAPSGAPQAAAAVDEA
jgi:hypothetical protein